MDFLLKRIYFFKIKILGFLIKKAVISDRLFYSFPLPPLEEVPEDLLLLLLERLTVPELDRLEDPEEDLTAGLDCLLGELLLTAGELCLLEELFLTAGEDCLLLFPLLTAALFLD